jgi:transposase
MRDIDVFGTLLGLDSGWVVSKVDVREDEQSVRLEVEHVGEVQCPTCGKVCPVHDHSAERVWRHLDTMQFTTLVVCRVPRADCSKHGVLQMNVPWAGPKSRFTSMFESLAIRYLELTKSQVRCARMLRLSANQVHDIMHRAVDRGLERRQLEVIPHIGIDEKSFQRRDFATILCDLNGKRVLAVERGHKEESAKKAFAVLPYRGLVKTVCMDMSEAYKKAASSGMGVAEIVHDRFHVAALLSAAVDETRRAEVKKRPELKESRYVWLKNPENLTDKQKTSFDLLVGAELKTAEAYALKQVFKSFFEQETPDQAMEFFVDWYDEVQKRSLPRMKKCAHTLATNINGLLAAVKWRLTNAYAESINASIQEVKTVARGFRRFENFRIAILFFLGKLELNPRKSP